MMMICWRYWIRMHHEHRHNHLCDQHSNHDDHGDIKASIIIMTITIIIITITMIMTLVYRHCWTRIIIMTITVIVMTIPIINDVDV